MYTIAHILNLFLSLLCVVQNQELAASRPASTRPAPPKARIEIVVDDYHGHKVADPYRWLEDGNSADTAVCGCRKRVCPAAARLSPRQGQATRPAWATRHDRPSPYSRCESHTDVPVERHSCHARYHPLQPPKSDPLRTRGPGDVSDRRACEPPLSEEAQRRGDDAAARRRAVLLRRQPAY